MTKRLPLMIEDPAEPQHVRELLQSGRDFNVTDYDYDQGLARHLGAVQAGAPMPKWAEGLQSSGGGAPAAAGIAGATLAGWVALPLITAAVVTAVVLSSGSNDAPQPNAAPAANSAAAPIAPPSVPSVQPSAEEPTHAVAPEPAGDPALSPAPRSEAGKPQGARPGKRAAAHGARADSQAPGARSPGAGGVPSVQARGGAPSGGNATGALASKQQQVATAAEAQPQAQEREAAAEQAAAPAEQPAEETARAQEPVKPEPARLDDARLEREMAMLAVAQRVLQTDPQRALNLARQGESEFAGSMFTQERQQLLLLALVKLGRVDEAKRLARPYLARYPNGPFSDRVRRALATGRVDR